ncbi:MAG: hypothetical protein JO353_07480 [Phycisphaerae bacterium]|nr:hypothetical protein [Phycisphaerae bacterium]
MIRVRDGIVAAAAFAAAASLGFAQAPATQPSPAELMAQIRSLQAQVNDMKAVQTEQSVANQKEIDATVDRVLNDANRRSKVLDVEGFTAGYDHGRFVLRSSDGAFSFSPMAQLQFRYSTAYNSAGSGDTQSGFELRRTKFGFDGTAFTKDLYYFFLWNTANGGTNAGNLNLEQAFVRYQLNHDFALQGGQYTDPAVHEQNVSSKKQLLVERSELDHIITGTSEAYDQAVGLYYNPSDSAWKGTVAFTDGFNSFDTNFQDEPTNPTDFGASARVEYKFMGNWGDYGQFTALGDKDELLVAGAGVAFTEGNSTNSVIHTADVQYDNPNGLSAYGAFLANYISNDTTNSYNYGFLGQVGYLLPNQNHWEIFGRYDWTKLDHAATIAGSTEDNFHELTGGVNYYFFGQNAKATVDLSYLPNGTPGSGSTDQTATTDNEFVLRAQFQLLL